MSEEDLRGLAFQEVSTMNICFQNVWREAYVAARSNKNVAEALEEADFVLECYKGRFFQHMTGKSYGGRSLED